MSWSISWLCSTETSGRCIPYLLCRTVCIGFTFPLSWLLCLGSWTSSSWHQWFVLAIEFVCFADSRNEQIIMSPPFKCLSVVFTNQLSWVINLSRGLASSFMLTQRPQLSFIFICYETFSHLSGSEWVGECGWSVSEWTSEWVSEWWVVGWMNEWVMVGG